MSIYLFSFFIHIFQVENSVKFNAMFFKLFSMKQCLWEPKQDEAPNILVWLSLVILFNAKVINAKIVYLFLFFRFFKSKRGQILAIGECFCSFLCFLILALSLFLFSLKFLEIFKLLFLKFFFLSSSFLLSQLLRIFYLFLLRWGR
jgi:hypothetical protein